MNTRKLHTLVIGSGAAGLSAALELHRRGVDSLAIYTEGLRMGTSINTGSDKQTYYKLGMYSGEADSPYDMACDLAGGGSMHGDLALIEAASSAGGFWNLIRLGVPFPHDEYGQYIGYKTDHDPRRRATSCGPYTSREMCVALSREVARCGIECRERRVAVELISGPDAAGGLRCCGAVFLNREEDGVQLETVLASNVVFAVGGPGGLFRDSVYPAVHTGAIGLALKAGAEGRNLPEFQYGLASTGFRWNVSGSYMQVLPRVISRAADGSDEREFLRDGFPDTAAMLSAVFLKGYQWPFSYGNLSGSSLIDVLVQIEIVERGRKVFLDYRSNPDGLDFQTLSPECREYLEKSGASGGTPVERLRRLNDPAYRLYLEHGIDLEREALPVAVCVQHNNGGLAGDGDWQSVNLKGLFPIGEVNGSHGVTRPGGSALNAGQVGALRCAEFIAAHAPVEPISDGRVETEALERLLEQRCTHNWKLERSKLQGRMSEAAGAVRELPRLQAALRASREQLAELERDGLFGLNSFEASETLRNRQLIFAAAVYLEAMIYQLESGVGSRGGAIELAPDGEVFCSALDEKWRVKPENIAFRRSVLASRWSSGAVDCAWEACRTVPRPDGWFEEVWREFRKQKGKEE